MADYVNIFRKTLEIFTLKASLYGIFSNFIILLYLKSKI